MSSEIESPCINICKLDKDTQTCTGCGRDIIEIIDWPTMTNEERQAVLDRIKNGRNS